MGRAPALLLLAAVAGCNSGNLTVSVADAPVDDATRVVVQFDGVEVEHNDGSVENFPFTPARQIDLLALGEGDSERLLDGVALEDGPYRAIELKVSASGSGNDSFVETAAGTRPLQLATANEGRLRVASSFEIGRDDALSLTVDFDLRKSILSPADAGNPDDPYELLPTLRLIRDDAAGAVFGTVGATRVPAGCRPAVYVYSGHGASPGDEGSATAPFASGRVRAAGTAFSYTVAWLPAGNYTAAFTCEAAADDPESDDAVTFSDPADVTVTAGQSTQHDFP